MNIYIVNYLVYILKRFWMVVLVATLLGGLGYIFVSSREPVYVASSRVFIGNALTLPNPDLGAVSVGERLAPTYEQFVKNFSVLNDTIAELGLEIEVDDLSKMVSTRIIIDTSILVIQVRTVDPQLSANIANTIAEKLIVNSPSNLSALEENQLIILGQQIEELENQIDLLQNQSVAALEALELAIENGEEARINELQEDYNTIQNQLTSSRATFAQFSQNYLNLTNRVNRLEIIEIARPPQDSTGLNPLLVAILVGVAGAGFAIASLLLFLEYVDTNIRLEGEARRVLDLPVLGSVKKIKNMQGGHQKYLTTGTLNQLSIAEQYRKAQANMLFMPDSRRDGATYLVASARGREGRTFTVVNLGTIIAELGLKVLLIDADMRAPAIHRLYTLDNSRGLATLLANQDDLELNQEVLKPYIQHTATPHLDVLPTGLDDIELSSQVLGFENLSSFMEDIRRELDYDVILIDAAPCLDYADSYLISTASQAKVILVIEAERTNHLQATKTLEQFLHVRSEVVGIILNKT